MKNILLIILSLSSFHQLIAYTIDGITYDLRYYNGTYCLRIDDVDTSKDGKLIIPDNVWIDDISPYLGSLPVFFIQMNSFANCNLLTEIVLPDTIVTIDGYSFTGCTSLETIDLPDDLTFLGPGAFSGCSSLKNVTIGSKLTNLRPYVFLNCYELRRITIPANITQLDVASFAYTSMNEVYIQGANTSMVDEFGSGYSLSSYRNSTKVYINDNIRSNYGSSFSGLNIIEYNLSEDAKFYSNALNLTSEISQDDYDAILDERDAAIAERDAKLTLNEVKDLRAGSKMIEIHNGQATLTMEVEQSDDLLIWTTGGASTLQIPIDAEAGKKFFRFKMTE